MAVKPEANYTVFTWNVASMGIPFRNGNFTMKRGTKFGLRLSGGVGLPKDTNLRSAKVRMIILEPGYGPSKVHTPSFAQLRYMMPYSCRKRGQ